MTENHPPRVTWPRTLLYKGRVFCRGCLSGMPDFVEMSSDDGAAQEVWKAWKAYRAGDDFPLLELLKEPL